MSVVLTALWLGLIACGAGPASAEPKPEPAASRPSVLLVTLDTTRADRIGAYGYAGARTPTLDRLAADGVVFENAVAPTPVTLPSHTSILTGVYPPAHGVRDNGAFALAPDARLLSEVMREHGWRTGAFVASYVLDRRFGLDQGFETYRDPSLASLGRGRDVERPANRVVDDAVSWLRTLPTDAPFFAWIHFYDPHAPYEPPQDPQRASDPYDGEIAFCDAELGRLLGFLRRRGLDDNLLVAVTSDHGESLGEHGEATHGIFVYRPTVSVPLIFSGKPVDASAGSRVSGPVSAADMAPTLLVLAGLPRDALPASPLPALFAPDGTLALPDPGRAVYSESYVPFHTLRWHALEAIVVGPHKLVRGRGTELYELDADPDESVNLADEQPQRAGALEKRLDAALAETSPLGWVDLSAPGAEDEQLLARLGYVVAGAQGDPLDPRLPDPREKIDDLARISEADEISRGAQALQQQPAATAFQRAERDAKARAELTRAREILEKVLRGSPDNPLAGSRLGTILNQLGDHEAAVPLLEAHVQREPYTLTARYTLATSRFALEQTEEAVREMRDLAARDPRFAAPFEWLAAYHASLGEYGRAAGWMTALLEHLEPDDPRRPQVTATLARYDSQRRAQGQLLAPPDAEPS